MSMAHSVDPAQLSEQSVDAGVNADLLQDTCGEGTRDRPQ
jgi:hypothetical protein